MKKYIDISLSNLLEKLHYLKLEYLLPLPLLLMIFGVTGESLTNLILSRSYLTVDKLQANTQTVNIQILANVIIIENEIEPEPEFTEIELKLANSFLKKLTFKIPATEISKAEAMIAQELGLSENIRTLPINTPIQIQSTVQIWGILAEIETEQGLTKVEVNTVNSLLKKLEFELPSTEINQVKAMIIQELGLSRENARILVSYRIKN